MKTLKITISGILFFLFLQNGFSQSDYAIGKEYIVRSKAKGEMTHVFKIRIDDNKTAHVKFMTDESRQGDKGHYTVIAPAGEVFVSLSAQKDGLIIETPSSELGNYYFITSDNKAFQIKKGMYLEGEEIRKQLNNKQINIQENKQDATLLDFIFNPEAEVISIFYSKGDVIEYKNAGILLKAEKVVFE